MTDTPISREVALREALAALCHEQWSGWMRYLFSKCDRPEDTFLVVMPQDCELRWARQMNTSYAELSEAEKDSDRKEADKFIALLAALPALQPAPTGDADIAAQLRDVMREGFMIGHCHGPSADYQVQLKFKTLEESQRCYTLLIALSDPDSRATLVDQGLLTLSKPAPPSEQAHKAAEAIVDNLSNVANRILVYNLDEIAAIITSHVSTGAEEMKRALIAKVKEIRDGKEKSIKEAKTDDNAFARGNIRAWTIQVTTLNKLITALQQVEVK